MKIIQVDNFNRETHDDHLICMNVNKQFGELFVDTLNNKYSGDHSAVFFRLVDNDYKLYKFEI